MASVNDVNSYGTAYFYDDSPRCYHCGRRGPQPCPRCDIGDGEDQPFQPQTEGGIAFAAEMRAARERCRERSLALKSYPSLHGLIRAAKGRRRT